MWKSKKKEKWVKVQTEKTKSWSDLKLTYHSNQDS